MRVHDVEILVSSHDAEIETRHGVGKLCYIWEYVYRISAPVFIEREKMPAAAELAGAAQNVSTDGRALEDLLPKKLVREFLRHELSEGVSGFESSAVDHAVLNISMCSMPSSRYGSPSALKPKPS